MSQQKESTETIEEFFIGKRKCHASIIDHYFLKSKCKGLFHIYMDNFNNHII